MAELVVRNIENTVKMRLQRRARRNGRSMEEEARDILRNAVKEEDAPAGGLGTAISALFAKAGLDFEIPELSGHFVKALHSSDDNSGLECLVGVDARQSRKEGCRLA